MTALITLCNQALAMIAAGSVASLNEPSIEARECNRFAQPLLNEMADWSDIFGFGRTRVVLAAVVNDRPAEWLYAYAAPADLDAAISVRAVEDAAYGLPIGGPYTLPLEETQPLAFRVEGGTIYTNVETATLVYSKKTIDANDLPPLGQKAFVDALAVRLAAPVKKLAIDKIAGLEKRAEVSRLRFIADEENKNPRQETRYISEAEYARMGIGV